MQDARRSIPSVDQLLASEPFAPLLADLPRQLIVSMLQRELQVLRSTLTDPSADTAFDAVALAARVTAAARDLARGTVVPVLNATGVVLHTNLGRAPLAAAAIAAIGRTAAGYCNLEYDLAEGARGSRYAHSRDLLTHLTGAEDALVVNNNAAALVLALNTFAQDRDAVISRGELVEIGGAFRVPEIMARSGAHLHEVGSTNRTHLQDYADALTGTTGAVLKVHPSNFMISGYTADVGIRELAGVTRQAGVPLIHDIGSGLLIDPQRIGLPAEEPTPRASLAYADVVTMSGDKLLGGPQCGIILGRTEHLERMRRNPLCRALRVDKLTLAALAATLRLYLDTALALQEVPVLRMLALTPAELEDRARAFAARCAAAGIDTRVLGGTSAVGGGACPAAALPTTLVQLVSALRPAAIEQRLRAASVPVVLRVVDDAAAIDLRTVDPADEPQLLAALQQVLQPVVAP